METPSSASWLSRSTTLLSTWLAVHNCSNPSPLAKLVRNQSHIFTKFIPTHNTTRSKRRGTGRPGLSKKSETVACTPCIYLTPLSSYISTFPRQYEQRTCAFRCRAMMLRGMLGTLRNAPMPWAWGRNTIQGPLRRGKWNLFLHCKCSSPRECLCRFARPMLSLSSFSFMLSMYKSGCTRSTIKTRWRWSLTSGYGLSQRTPQWTLTCSLMQKKGCTGTLFVRSTRGRKHGTKISRPNIQILHQGLGSPEMGCRTTGLLCVASDIPYDHTSDFLRKEMIAT